MKIFSFALLSATAVKATQEIDLSATDVPANSKLGNRILSKARQLEGDNDITWMAGYSIKFQQCVASQDYYGGYFAAEGQNEQGNYAQENNAEDVNGGNYNNGQQGGYNGYYNEAQQQRNDYAGMYEQRLVHFKLCPSDSCRSCANGADYVVDLNEFIEAMLEAKQSANEYNCARVRDMCYCENAQYKNQCLSSCYQNANLGDSCNEGQQNGFDLQEALQCARLEVKGEQQQYMQYQNGQYQQQGGQNMEYYVGPYCSANGKKIHLGVFMDETCTWPAPKNTYESLNYGQSLPYSKQSILSNDCISCKEPKEQNEQNYWDQQDEDEVTDVCERLYEDSGKCEKNLAIWTYKDNTACGFIETLKQPLSIPTNVSAKVFAGIFGVATAILAGASIYLYNKSKRTNVDLASAEAQLA